MVIKIVKQGNDLDDLYMVEVITPQGTWRSHDPIPGDELGRELLLMGYDPVEIQHALKDAGVGQLFPETRKATKEIRPLLQAALAENERSRSKNHSPRRGWPMHSLGPI